MSKDIFNCVKDYTMTDKERVDVLVESVFNILDNSLEGDFVECGVWRGGSVLAMLYALQCKNQQRTIWLYDTFEGMSKQTEKDWNVYGESADDLLKDPWFKCESTLQEVKFNLFKCGFNYDNLKFIKGKVEDTIPINLPKSISLLRLDTDWHESTLHELKYLYPLLVSGGVLIVDDYNYWKGATEAVDEYFKNEKIEFKPISHCGIIGIKP